DLVGEPILITRNKDNELSAMYNICPHRGTIVEQNETGNKKIFQCMYHGWTFHLDGKLNRAPNFPENEVGDRTCLKPIQLEVFQQLIFVNLDPTAAPLSFNYDELMEELNHYSFLSSLKLVKSDQRIIHANWKAIVDNYLECDHCKINHPSFSKTFDMNDYHIDPFKNFTRQYSELKKQDSEKQAYFYWIWPNLMLSIYPQGFGNMTTSQIIPITPEKSLAIYNYYFISDDISEEQQELMTFVDQVRDEDIELVELLQTGFQTQAFDSGIYSPRENGLHYFHQRIRDEIPI
ncbi:MAG TPA: aromatic ring-hydroxylating dioxygenase subunit alpha, partial [Atopostipes sp.]|nr:aromatic ring-hydroxylating dioxygenase subunit alpha [Atopostipes sp.]